MTNCRATACAAFARIGVKAVKGTHAPDRDLSAFGRGGVHVVQLLIVGWVFQVAKEVIAVADGDILICESRTGRHDDPDQTGARGPEFPIPRNGLGFGT